jgi:hypothetical protein
MSVTYGKAACYILGAKIRLTVELCDGTEVTTELDPYEALTLSDDIHKNAQDLINKRRMP